jgi:hypothetical protein
MGFKVPNPVLLRGSIFPKQFGDLLVTMSDADQQEPVQPMLDRNSLDQAIPCWMIKRMTSASAISSALMTGPPQG